MVWSLQIVLPWRWVANHFKLDKDNEPDEHRKIRDNFNATMKKEKLGKEGDLGELYKKVQQKKTRNQYVRGGKESSKEDSKADKVKLEKK